jgi:hypothetical protein
MEGHQGKNIVAASAACLSENIRASLGSILLRCGKITAAVQVRRITLLSSKVRIFGLLVQHATA